MNYITITSLFEKEIARNYEHISDFVGWAPVNGNMEVKEGRKVYCADYTIKGYCQLTCNITVQEDTGVLMEGFKNLNKYVKISIDERLRNRLERVFIELFVMRFEALEAEVQEERKEALEAAKDSRMMQETYESLTTQFYRV